MNEIDRYMKMNYPIRLRWLEADGVFVAEFPDLPGCLAYGTNVQEAYDKAREAKKEWLAVTIQQGYPVPLPTQEEDYSGRLLLRIPSSLHRAISERAKASGTSMNQYLVHLLSVSLVRNQMADELAELRKQMDEVRAVVEMLAPQSGTNWLEQSGIQLVTTSGPEQVTRFAYAHTTGLRTGVVLNRCLQAERLAPVFHYDEIQPRQKEQKDSATGPGQTM
jgi:antitoxin HicB